VIALDPQEGENRADKFPKHSARSIVI
jgi:hypothetical protein